MNALETVHLEKRFGGIVPTNDVNLSVREGARHALIGPNGAGKTTLINLLTGVLRPSRGQVKLAGNDITSLRPHQRVARGMSRTFQINQLFADLSPLEAIVLVIGERENIGARFWRPFGANDAIVAEAVALARQFGLADVIGATRTNRLFSPCADDYGAYLTETTKAALQSTVACIVDKFPKDANGQVVTACNVKIVTLNPDGTETRVGVPRCDAAGSVHPCWRVAPDPKCATVSPDGVSMQIDLGTTWGVPNQPPPHSSAMVECATTAG